MPKKIAIIEVHRLVAALGLKIPLKSAGLHNLATTCEHVEDGAQLQVSDEVSPRHSFYDPCIPTCQRVENDKQ
jgi:hypothetical protein